MKNSLVEAVPVSAKGEVQAVSKPSSCRLLGGKYLHTSLQHPCDSDTIDIDIDLARMSEFTGILISIETAKY